MGHVFNQSSNKNETNNSSNAQIINENHVAVNKLIDLAINQHACLSETILKQTKNGLEIKNLAIAEEIRKISDLDAELNEEARKKQTSKLILQIQTAHDMISNSTKDKRKCDFSRDGILRALDSLHSEEIMSCHSKQLAQMYIRLLYLQENKVSVAKCSSIETIDEPNEIAEGLAKILYTCEEIDENKLTSIEFSSKSNIFDDKIENLQHSSSASEFKTSADGTIHEITDDSCVIL